MDRLAQSDHDQRLPRHSADLRRSGETSPRSSDPSCREGKGHSHLACLSLVLSAPSSRRASPSRLPLPCRRHAPSSARRLRGDASRRTHQHTNEVSRTRQTDSRTTREIEVDRSSGMCSLLAVAALVLLSPAALSSVCTRLAGCPPRRRAPHAHAHQANPRSRPRTRTARACRPRMRMSRQTPSRA